MAATNTGRPTTFTTPSDREIVMTRVVDAPRQLVFEAWTNPEHLPHWMLGPRRLDHARLRDRSPPGRGVALRLAPFRRHRNGDAWRVSGDQCRPIGSSRPSRGAETGPKRSTRWFSLRRRGGRRSPLRFSTHRRRLATRRARRGWRKGRARASIGLRNTCAP